MLREAGRDPGGRHHPRAHDRAREPALRLHVRHQKGAQRALLLHGDHLRHVCEHRRLALGAHEARAQLRDEHRVGPGGARRGAPRGRRHVQAAGRAARAQLEAHARLHGHALS